MKQVLVVIPSMYRPEGLLRAVESVLSTAPGVKVVCVLDMDDEPSRAILGTLDDESVCIVTVTGDMPTASRWNAGAEYSEADYFVIGADDIVFQPGWLEAALGAMDVLGGECVVGFNEGASFGVLAAHFMVSRKYAARGLGGCIMIPSYEHGFTDVEVTARAKSDNRLAFAEGAVIQHLHPFYGTAETDEIYEKGNESNARDEALFARRLDAGFPDDFEPVIRYTPPPGWGTVAVGCRTYKSVDDMFFASWGQFLVAGLRRGDRLLDGRKILGKAHHIAANAMAVEFLKTDCDSLLMVDDDMILPYNALSLMRDNESNWEYDIAMGFCTHKTYPPHAVAYELAEEQPGLPESLGGLRYNALAHLEDDAVTDVDAVGLAFTLIKRHVLEDMLSEYGPEYTTWFDTGGHSEMEDMRFSRRYREAGFRACVDTSAKIGHVGRHVYGWNEHQQFIKLLEKNNG